jgi:uncharacterized delta-60 repeat protein
MRVNDIYLAFLSAFESQDVNYDSFFSDFQSISESIQSNLEKSLAEMMTLTKSALPTYQTISASQYYAEYGSRQVQLTLNGSGIDKLFGGGFTTGIVSVSSITVDYPSEALHLSVSGSGLWTNLDIGVISGSFNSFHFNSPLFDVAASGSISVAGGSVTSPLNIVGSVQQLSITYPENSVLLSLVGKINYYQDAFGNINYSGDVTNVYLSKDGADLTINGDLSCTFDEQNGLNLSGSNWSTGIISVSSIAVNYPSQSIHLAFSGSGSGLSADFDTGEISGTFNSFHFSTPLLDVTASGSISVVGSSVISSIDVVGALDELSITYPADNVLLSILGDIDYTQDASGQFHYDGSATEIHFNKAGADLALKGKVFCAFDEQNGLSLSGSVHEIDVQIGDTIIECVGDIHFGENGIESGDINNLNISVNGNYYDASTLNLKDLIADLGVDGVVYLDQNGDWCINDATFPQFSDTIDYLLDIINPSPRVTSFTPADAATGVSVGRDIILTFSEAILRGSGTIEIHTGSVTGPLVDADLTLAGNTLTINPAIDLANSTKYFVTLSDGSITDFAGNPYAGTTTYDFTTEVSSFMSGRGKVTTDFGGSDSGSSIVLQSDGKIIVAGESSGGGDGGFAVVRYNADGSLDTTFDIDGKVTTDFGGLEYARSVALQSNGKIVVAGYNGISSSGGGDFAVVRYNADGSLDTTFDGDGKVITDFGGWDEAESVKIDSNGRIVVAGYSGISSSGGGDFAVVRYNTNGSLDSSFGANHNGKIITDVGAEEYAHSVIVQSDNKIVVIGDTAISSSGASDFALVRYNADGSLDTDFGQDGKITTDFDGCDFVGGVTVQSDGKIVVVGESYALSNTASGDQDFVLVRYNADGTPDTTFSGDGKIVADFGGGDSARSVAVQADGKIVVTGYSSPAGSSGGGDVIVARYNADGTLDPTFSSDGVVKTAIGDESEGNGVVVQSDGRILVAGQSVNNGNPDFLLVRYNSDGSMGMAIDFDGTPVDNAMANETFTDFYVETTLLSQQGYFASMIAPDSPHSIIHLYDDNSDGLPDRFIDNDESGIIVWNSNGTWTAVITSGGDGGGSGRLAFDADGNVVGLYATMDNRVDTMTSTSLTFDLGTTGATLASTGSIIVKLVNSDRSRDTANVAVSSLTFDGTHLTIPLSGTDPVTLLPYAFDPSSGRELFVQIPAGVVVGQSVTSFKAWHVGAMNDNSYALSPMTIVHNGAGTSAADWVIGTSGNDSITTGAGDDVLQWSDGNDTIDGGDGYDKLYMSFSSPNAAKKIDSQGVLHIGEASLVTGEIVVDAYRITRLSLDSYQLQQMDSSGTNVVRTMLLNNAEAIGVGNSEVHYFSIPLKVGYNNESVNGTPWRDTISLSASNISTLSQVWGDSSKDTLSVDMGAGYSKLEVVSDGLASTLKGTLISGGAVVDLGSFSEAIPSQYNYTATMTIGTGGSAHSFTVNNIEAYHFTSGGVVLDIYPLPPIVTTFSPADGASSVVVSSDIVLTFIEPIQTGFGTIEIHGESASGALVANYDVATSPNITIAGNTLTINPTVNLASGTHYFVTFTEGSIKDLEGNSFAGTMTYDFTTAPASSVHDISGSVTFWKTGAVIADVSSTFASDSMTTGSDGLFHHNAMAEGTYALAHTKISGTAESNAIKANDALAALKIAVGMNPNADGSAVLPYQYLAADVNHDGQVKAADALNILKMAVKLSSAPEKEWLFVPESVGSETMSRTNVVWPDNPIPVILDLDQELHIIGLVKGDVNGSWV